VPCGPTESQPKRCSQSPAFADARDRHVQTDRDNNNEDGGAASGVSMNVRRF